MIEIGVNSWATLTQANEYFSTWYGRPSSVWAVLTDSDKESLIITSYNGINTNELLDIPADSTDPKVIEAQLRFSWWYYLNGDDSHQRGGLIDQGLKSFKTLDFSESYQAPNRLPQDIQDLLSDYYDNQGAAFVDVRRKNQNVCE